MHFYWAVMQQLFTTWVVILKDEKNQVKDQEMAL